MTALRAFITIGLAMFWLLAIGPPMFMSVPSVYTGVHLIRTGALVQRNVVRIDTGSPAYRAGLRTGDILGCLSPRDRSLLIWPSRGLEQGYAPGTIISTCVQRNGAVHSVTFTAQTGPIVRVGYRSEFDAALRLCVAIVFFLTGIALVLARPSPMTWIFYVYCLCSAPSFSAMQVWTILPAWQYAVLADLPGISSVSAAAFLLLFAILVPSDGIPAGWRRTAFKVACAIAVAQVLLSSVALFYTNVPDLRTLRDVADEALTALTLLVVLMRLLTMERSERGRFGWAAFAIAFGVVANDIRTIFAIGPLHWTAALAGDLIVVMPLCLMYAILRRHVIDVRFVISRTVVYAAITTLVIAIIGAVDWATSVYLHQARVAMAIDALVTIALGFVLHRTYGWLEHAADFLLFRKKHESETYLNRLARSLLRAGREETIDRALVHDPYDAFQLTMAALFRDTGSSFALSCAAGWDAPDAPAFDRDHDLVRFLLSERTRLHIRDLRKHVAALFLDRGAAPAVAIPLFQGDDLTAFAVYGIHRDGTKLDPDEVETLERLCETAAQAYIRIENLRYRTLSARSVPT